MKKSIINISLFILTFIVGFGGNVWGQENTGHEGVLYLDSKCSDAGGCIVDKETITQNLNTLKSADVIVNVIYTSQYCSQMTLYQNQYVFGPLYDGNNMWYAPNVDFLIIVEPGRSTVYYDKNLYSDDYNSMIRGIRNKLLPYGESNFCQINEVLKAIGTCKNIDLNNGSVDCDKSNEEENELILDVCGNHYDENNTYLKNLKKIINSSYNTKIGIYHPYYLINNSSNEDEEISIGEWMSNGSDEYLKNTYGDVLWFGDFYSKLRQNSSVYVFTTKDDNNSGWHHFYDLDEGDLTNIQKTIFNNEGINQMFATGVTMTDGYLSVLNNNYIPGKNVCDGSEIAWENINGDNLKPMAHSASWENELNVAETNTEELSEQSDTVFEVDGKKAAVIYAGADGSKNGIEFKKDVESFVKLSPEMAALVKDVAEHFGRSGTYGEDNPGLVKIFITTSDNKIPYSYTDSSTGITEEFENSYYVARKRFFGVQLGTGSDDYKAALHFHFDKIEHKIKVDVRHSKYFDENAINFDDLGEANNVRDAKMEQAVLSSPNSGHTMGEFEYGLLGSNSIFHRVQSIVTATNVVVKSLATTANLPSEFWTKDISDNVGKFVYNPKWRLKVPSVIMGGVNGYLENTVVGLAPVITMAVSFFIPSSEKAEVIDKSKNESADISTSNGESSVPGGFIRSLLKEMFPFGEGATQNIKYHNNSRATVNAAFAILTIYKLGLKAKNKYDAIKNAGKSTKNVTKSLFQNLKWKDLKISGDEAATFLNKLDAIGKVASDNFKSILAGIESKAGKVAFAKKFAHNPEFLEIFKEDVKKGAIFKFTKVDGKKTVVEVLGLEKEVIDLEKALKGLPDPVDNPYFWKGADGVEGFMEKFSNTTGEFMHNGTPVNKKALFLSSISKWVKKPVKKWGKKFGLNPKHYDVWLELVETPGYFRINEKLLYELAKKPGKLAKINKFYSKINPKLPEGLKAELAAGVKKLPTKVTKIVNGVKVIVKYDKFGFPKFHCKKCIPSIVPDMDYIVNIEEMVSKTGDVGMVGKGSDFTKANKALKKVLKNDDYIKKNSSGSSFELFDKYGNKKGDYTWHHHQDGKHMIPVKTEIHDLFSHTGGNRIMKTTKTPDFRSLFDFFKFD